MAGVYRTRGLCPSCHSKRLEEWGEWMREELLLDVPQREERTREDFQAISGAFEVPRAL